MPVSAETLAVLMEKGLSGSDLLDIVRAIDMDAASSQPVKSPRQARNSRYYESHKDELKAKREEKASEIVLNKTSEQDALIKNAPPEVPPKNNNQTPSLPPQSSLRSVSERGREIAARAAELFEQFKLAYPRRAGSQPWQPAARKFLSAIGTGGDFEDRAAAIIGGAVAYAASTAGEDPRFVAQAVTWLNQKRWLDDHRPAQPSARAGPPKSNMRLAAELIAEMENRHECHDNSAGPIIDADAAPAAGGRGFGDIFEPSRPARHGSHHPGDRGPFR